MKLKVGTYRVTMWNGDQYIFGNNYKTWIQHAIEYAMPRFERVSRHQIFKKVEYSRTRFVDDGGLKYCSADTYHEVIEDVARQMGKKLKPYEEYVFTQSADELIQLDKALKRW